MFKTFISSEKKILLILVMLFLLVMIYIFYLNLVVIGLKDSLNSKENLYLIQINNRIEEIAELNQQVIDLREILNIGLNINNSDNIYFNTKLDEKDKDTLLLNIPSGLPLKTVHISSRYGERIHPISGFNTFHNGIDLKIEKGQNVYSTADGIVLKVRNEDTGGYGKFLIVLHNYGFSSLYAHLDNIIVKEGDFIPKNTLLGFSGNTGNSTGPHLHYEIKFLEKNINPIDFLYWNKKTFSTIFNNTTDIDWENLMYLIKNRTN